MEIDLDILMILTLLGMLIAIFSGVHIALALGATAMVGTITSGAKECRGLQKAGGRRRE